MPKIFITHKDPLHVGFDCPGCGDLHTIPVAATRSVPPAPTVWGFNFDYDNPTIIPSLKVTYAPAIQDQNHKDVVCHSVITNGQIAFQADSTHKLAGQTVPLSAEFNHDFQEE